MPNRKLHKLKSDITIYNKNKQETDNRHPLYGHIFPENRPKTEKAVEQSKAFSEATLQATVLRSGTIEIILQMNIIYIFILCKTS